MATVKSTLSLEDKMSSALKNIQASAKQLGSGLDGLSKKLDQAGSAATTAGSIFKSMLGANLVTKGIDAIVGQIGSAIDRFDTLNNYTSIMEGLGFGASESQASIDRLKDGLDGLPTTLDDAVSSVQRFAAVNENIKASTEMTLALNDALAAGGTPAATQAAALEQISQAYSKGKFDAIEYKTMMTAMPAQLKQIAQEMGYTSTAVGGDFYTALQTGEIGMNSMMNTMMKLDKQTGGFHDQALKATNGIRTSFTNMRTAITKGLTTLIEKINTALKNSGLPTIQEMIKNIGKTIQNILSTIGTVVGKILEFIAPALKFIIDNIDTIIIIVGVLIGVYAAWEVATGLVTTAQWLLNAAMSANPIGIIIALIVVWIIVLLLLWEKCEGFREAVVGQWVSMMKGLGRLYNLTIDVYNGVMDMVTSLNETANAAFKGMINAFANTAISMIESGNGIIGIFKKIVDVYNQIAGTLGGKTINIDAALTTEGINKIRSAALGAVDSILPTTYEKKDKIPVDRMDEMLGKAGDKIKNFTIGGYINEKMQGVGQSIKNSVDDTNNLLDDVTNSNGSGGGKGGSGKAINTTTNDRLLSDEDMQLLLDIATRDYKLSYQQVTPNITLTFGDIRETADVDNILDQVADRLEEIYDSNLEVPVSD